MRLAHPRAGVAPSVVTVPSVEPGSEGRPLHQADTLARRRKNIEVWLATGPGPDGRAGLRLPQGDCRYQIPGSTTINDAEIAALMHQYDDNMLPKESKRSAWPPRDVPRRPTTT